MTLRLRGGLDEEREVHSMPRKIRELKGVLLKAGFVSRAGKEPEAHNHGLRKQSTFWICEKNEELSLHSHYPMVGRK